MRAYCLLIKAVRKAVSKLIPHWSNGVVVQVSGLKGPTNDDEGNAKKERKVPNGTPYGPPKEATMRARKARGFQERTLLRSNESKRQRPL
jgi:hypothetical protein